MKKTILAVITTILFTMPCALNAQNDDFNRHEVFAGIGIWNTSNLINAYSDMFSGALMSVHYGNQTATPTFTIGYKYYLSKRFGIGGTVSTSFENWDAYRDMLVGVPEFHLGQMTKNSTSLIAELSFDYLHTKLFKIYGLAGVGPTFLSQTWKEDEKSKNETKTMTFCDFQFSPVGIKVGNNFGGYAEFGFGYKGIISLGVFARF